MRSSGFSLYASAEKQEAASAQQRVTAPEEELARYRERFGDIEK
ncbi:MAG: hypothetical protein U0Z53_11880 [Blastocatellia bacterium]